MATGDFNADGKTDLAACSAGRVYLFYSDGTIPSTAATADVSITGVCKSLAAGDFNDDGKTDLAVGDQYGSNNYIGRTSIFYNDGSYPTLSSAADVVIVGEADYTNFGFALSAGDFNADGKTDLAVGSLGYEWSGATSTGRTYIFYNDGAYPASALSADVRIVSGYYADYFGSGLAAGDFNADNKTDLAVAAKGHATSTGRVYVYYNDGSYPAVATSADITITGEGINNYFGYALGAGDFNADGRVDLVASSPQNSSNAGRVYIFNNDGSIPTLAASADVKISGEANSLLGGSLVSGDFNNDGKVDLAAGAGPYSSGTGRAYLFYNDGSIPTTAATADIKITGAATGDNFGSALVTGDLNGDTAADLVVGAIYFPNNNQIGRVYIFKNDGTYASAAGSADNIITGEQGSDLLGGTLAAGDFNADGKVDLAVGAPEYFEKTGRTYVFYANSTISGSVSNADVVITGESTEDSFGGILLPGDFNADGKTDLAVGAELYPNWNELGRVYIFYNDGTYPTSASSADAVITGERNGCYFGSALAAGDLNADGKTDLVVGSWEYPSWSENGRVYIFYNDGSYTATASTADAIINYEGSGDGFGYSLATGDFNDDDRIDLAVGAHYYSNWDENGRVYLFYNDGSYPTNASSADVEITDDNWSEFGMKLMSGDFNDDGKTDLAVADDNVNVFFFYNDGSYPSDAADADLVMGGISTYYPQFISGDVNGDGKDDFIIGDDEGGGAGTGAVYVIYGGKAYPPSVSLADIIISSTGQEEGFGVAVAIGDFNNGGKVDLAVGLSDMGSNTSAVDYILFDSFVKSIDLDGHIKTQGNVKFE
jgi:hypothetical protein